MNKKIVINGKTKMSYDKQLERKWNNLLENGLTRECTILSNCNNNSVKLTYRAQIELNKNILIETNDFSISLSSNSIKNQMDRITELFNSVIKLMEKNKGGKKIIQNGFVYNIWYNESYKRSDLKELNIVGEWDGTHDTYLNSQRVLRILINKYSDREIDKDTWNTILYEEGIKLFPISIKQLNNVKDAVDYMNLITSDEVLVIKKLHKILMDGILDDAGEYRTVDVQPSSYNRHYLSPELIDERITTLISFYNNKAQNINKDFNREYLLLITLFFSEFLLIHPFIDGNGRTARIICGYLLWKMPFAFDGKHSDLYMKCLEKRFILDLSPIELSYFIFLELQNNLGEINYILC